jgi:hypothetical protein
METIVKINWDKPEMKEWLCADNIKIALSAYCKNTKFNVEVYASQFSLPTEEEIKDIISEVTEMHPYKKPGDRNSYLEYAEGWSDACNEFLSRLAHPEIEPTRVNYCQIVPQTDEENKAMYMAEKKEKLVEMLIEANKTIAIITGMAGEKIDYTSTITSTSIEPEQTEEKKGE